MQNVRGEDQSLRYAEFEPSQAPFGLRDGVIWFDQTANAFRAQINGVAVPISGSFSQLVPGTNNLPGTFAFVGNTVDVSAATFVPPSGWFQTNTNGGNVSSNGLNLINGTSGAGQILVSNPGSNQVAFNVANFAGGGTSLFAATLTSDLQGDILTKNNSGVWVNKTPGVPGRTVSGTTDTINCAAGGDRGTEVTYTNAGLVTVTIGQAGTTCLSNFYVRLFGTGAGGIKIISSTSTLNGIAPATGITYLQNTWVDVVSLDNVNWTLTAARAVKAGTGMTETLNADGSVTVNVTPVVTTGHTVSAVLNCSAASASGTAYTCSTSPTFVPADGDAILFEADVANTGAATLNVNSSSAAPIKKQGGGTALAANDLLAGQDSLLIFDGTNWQMQGQTGNAAAGGSTRLDQILAATVTPTAIASGNFIQEWDWAQTSNTQAAFTFGETSAATGGTITTPVANQVNLRASTASNSTASPFSVVQGSLTNTVATPAAQIQTTWNNAGLTAKAFVVSVTNSSSNANSTLIEAFGGAAGATSEFSVKTNGNTTLAGNLSVGGGTFSSVVASTGCLFQGGTDGGGVGTGGPATFRGADNPNTTAASSGGSATLRGGDETGSTANALNGGAVTIRGGNATLSTSTTATGGAISITGGSCVSVTSATTCAGQVKINQPYFSTGTATANDLACITAQDTIASCSGTTVGQFVGVIDSAVTNHVFLTQLGVGGTHVFNATSATFTNGHFVCQSAAAANLVVDSATVCSVGAGIGIYIGATGTQTAPRVFMRPY